MHRRAAHAAMALSSPNLQRVAAGFVLISLVIGIGYPLEVTHAASRSDYQAMVVSMESPKVISRGASSTVTVTLKNIGPASWLRDGTQFVSLYHYDPLRKIETTSVISGSGWETGDRVAKVPTSISSKGEVKFAIPVRAPDKAGTYHAEFVLVAENFTRMSGSRFGFDLTVTDSVASPTPITTATVPTAAPAPATPVLQPTGDGRWKAELVTLGGSEWQIDVDNNVFVTAQFKNIGREIWKRDGAAYVSVYATEGTKERQSPFRTALWPATSQAVRLQESEVKPGSIGTFKFELRAPLTPGRYSETFTLAAEDSAWIEGGSFRLPIHVPLTAEYIARQASTGATAAPLALTSSQFAKNAGYSSTLLLRSASEVQVLGNGSVQFQVGFKNTGTAAWATRSLKLAQVFGASVGLSSFRDPTWIDAAVPVIVNGATKPGEVGFLNFKIKGPPKKGVYKASFQLVADGFSVDGGQIDIPVTVTADGYFEPEPAPKPTTTSPSTSQIPSPSSNFSINPQPLTGSEADLPAEPMIRVGLYKTTDDRMVVRAKYAPLSVIHNGRTVCRLAVGEQTSVRYDRTTALYTLSGGPCSEQSPGVYQFRTDDGSSPMEIADYSRPISWLPGANDNTFRRHLELLWVPIKDSVWVVNELPIESYLKGIAETSNVSPQQYQRALLVGARTYAVYHVSRNTKHGGAFHVDAHLDQVYRGYGAEARGTNIVQAVDSTRGQIVTYQGKLAITPYFSRSDGRTRAWGEVWYGGSNYPWLVSVPVPDDIGKTLWGHGVGMSATGALQMDAKHGKNYQEILGHFYRGTELRRVYK